MNFDRPNLPERRQSPRFDLDIEVDLVLDNGTLLTVTSRNISSSGMQIICDNWVTDEIEPRGIQNHAINHLRFKLIVDLPIRHEGRDETKKLYSICRIMSVQRLSQDEYMLNLAFLTFESGSEKVLDEFIDQHEQKKTVIDAYG